MESPDEAVSEAVLVMCVVLGHRILMRNVKKKRKKRRWWTREWIAQKPLQSLGEELTKHPEDFKNLLRMSDHHFQYLLEKVMPTIQRQDTNMREATPAKTKLEITLRYLATGDSFKSLEFLFKVPKSTISKFIEEVLDAICCVLEEFIQVSN